MYPMYVSYPTFNYYDYSFHRRLFIHSNLPCIDNNNQSHYSKWSIFNIYINIGFIILPRKCIQ